MECERRKTGRCRSAREYHGSEEKHIQGGEERSAEQDESACLLDVNAQKPENRGGRMIPDGAEGGRGRAPMRWMLSGKALAASLTGMISVSTEVILRGMDGKVAHGDLAADTWVEGVTEVSEIGYSHARECTDKRGRGCQ